MHKYPEINLEIAQSLIDFSSGQVKSSYAKTQLEGTVGLYNILCNNKAAYLADEVGMGKTYIALGVMALMKRFNPNLRVLYITPRENIQRKWAKELKNFIKNNYKICDNHVKSPNGLPAFQYHICRNLEDFLHTVTSQTEQDYFLRMGSFSFGLRDEMEDRLKHVNKLNDVLPWVDTHELKRIEEKQDFKKHYAKIINSIIPHFDLLIVDEAHNLKHGREGASSRNQTLLRILGHQDEKYIKESPTDINYSSKIDRVLLLSATPLETGYEELYNQLDLFNSGSVCPELIQENLTEDQKKEAAKRILIRRLNNIDVNDISLTKNEYRREWRKGGMRDHSQKLEISDIRQKLTVALIQKKISEILGKSEVNRSFQIGMLASFESFMSSSKIRREIEEKGLQDNSNFDGSDQTDKDEEKEGIDTYAIEKIASDYEKKFKETLPHPKLDQVADRLGLSFQENEKYLVFVRRIKTVPELKAKVILAYDEWIKKYIFKSLKSRRLKKQFENVYKIYLDQRKKEIDLSTGDKEEDKGGKANFFQWFFRSTGLIEIFSGGDFRDKLLTSQSSYFFLFFEDNYVLNLLDYPEDVLKALAEIKHTSAYEIEKQLREKAQSYITQQSPSLFNRYQALQNAGLDILSEEDNEIGKKAQEYKRLFFYSAAEKDEGSNIERKNISELLSVRTFFTELRKHKELKEQIWCKDDAPIIEQEQRKELLASICGLGHSLVDLYISFINIYNNLKDKGAEKVGTQERYFKTIDAFIKRLKVNSQTKGLTAYYELNQTSKNFQIICNSNFPDIKYKKISELSKYYSQNLRKQEPVGGMYGSVLINQVYQFRMPGYPMVLISTDVLQEGEDLHLFCKNVVHYGISWTPSAIEQRIGRVDRINSFLQRRVSRLNEITLEDCIQVFYPFLYDTVERLQVYTIYRRINTFIRLIHDTLGELTKHESYIDSNKEMIYLKESEEDIEPIKTKLKSPFDVKSYSAHLFPPFYTHINPPL